MRSKIAVGKQVKDIFSSTEDVVMWTDAEDDQPEYNLVVDKEKRCAPAFRRRRWWPL